MEHYAIYSVDLTSDTYPNKPDAMKPTVGEWTLTEDDDGYDYDYLAEEFGDERFRDGQHRKWVAVLTTEERTALLESMYAEGEGEPTMGMLTEYGWLPAVCYRDDPMDWNVGGVTNVIDTCLYITPPHDAEAEAA